MNYCVIAIALVPLKNLESTKNIIIRFIAFELPNLLHYEQKFLMSKVFK